MCACRLEAQSSAASTPQASPSGELGFEDFYPYLMEEGGGDGAQESPPDDIEEGDVFAQLAQKERDLILAAELGKALLEKNQDLTKRNEGLAEEYNQKIEELTQEKHELRIRLENVEAEYETTVKDLQHEITSLRHELEEQQMTTRQGDRTRSQIVHELNQQNERLAEQLRKTAANEESLQNQVDGLRQQIMCRRNSMHEHVHQLEVLREEIRKQEREMRELQDTNHRLHERIEEMSLLSTTHSFLDQSTTSLLSELEMSGLGDGLGLPLQNGNKDSLSSSNGSQENLGASTNRPNTLYIPGVGVTNVDDLDDEEDIECDDDVAMVTNYSGSESLSDCQMMSHLQNSLDEEDGKDSHDSQDVWEVDSATNSEAISAEVPPQHPSTLSTLSPSNVPVDRTLHARAILYSVVLLKQEVMEAYKSIKRMLRDLRGSASSQGSNSPDDLELQQFKSGSLVQVLEELKGLMYDLCRLQSQKPDSGSERGAVGGFDQSDDLTLLEVKVQSVQHELKITQEELSRLRAHLALKDQQLEAKTEELTDLTHKLSLRHDELMSLQAERDRLLDGAAGIITPDDILTQARSDRDQAIEKRNSMEAELASAKLDLMNLDCQLLEAIQQKVQLSQQLEQWEDISSA